MELKEIREKIDATDSKLTELFIERMNLSGEVAAIKAKEGIALTNKQREKEIVYDETQKMPEEIKRYGKQFYETLFSLSKAYQAKNSNLQSQTLDKVLSAVSETKEFPTSATVACQGVLGAYSQLAADKMIEISKITYFKDWSGVFTAVEKGLCRYGVLPIENSSVGSVGGVYDLMLKHNFYIVKAVKLKISHFLLAKKGVKLENVKEIYSHEKAIEQCSDFIKQHNFKVNVCENTAVAARLVSESSRDDIACISSEECASIYNLQVLKPHIHDNENNYTRFILISKRLEIFSDANKISVMVYLPHEAGSLNSVLNRFSAIGLNLTKLESRPIPQSPFEFAFYFDFEADVKNRDVQALISELDSFDRKLIFLGSYSEKN